jgi:hypothetical protein
VVVNHNIQPSRTRLPQTFALTRKLPQSYFIVAVMDCRKTEAANGVDGCKSAAKTAGDGFIG